jgi:hypothetical protein
LLLRKNKSSKIISTMGTLIKNVSMLVARSTCWCVE